MTEEQGIKALEEMLDIAELMDDDELGQVLREALKELEGVRGVDSVKWLTGWNIYHHLCQTDVAHDYYANGDNEDN